MSYCGDGAGTSEIGWYTAWSILGLRRLAETSLAVSILRASCTPVSCFSAHVRLVFVQPLLLPPNWGIRPSEFTYLTLPCRAQAQQSVLCARPVTQPHHCAHRGPRSCTCSLRGPPSFSLVRRVPRKAQDAPVPGVSQCPKGLSLGYTNTEAVTGHCLGFNGLRMWFIVLDDLLLTGLWSLPSFPLVSGSGQWITVIHRFSTVLFYCSSDNDANCTKPRCALHFISSQGPAPIHTERPQSRSSGSC